MIGSFWGPLLEYWEILHHSLTSSGLWKLFRSRNRLYSRYRPRYQYSAFYIKPHSTFHQATMKAAVLKMCRTDNCSRGLLWRTLEIWPFALNKTYSLTSDVRVLWEFVNTVTSSTGVSTKLNNTAFRHVAKYDIWTHLTLFPSAHGSQTNEGPSLYCDLCSGDWPEIGLTHWGEVAPPTPRWGCRTGIGWGVEGWPAEVKSQPEFHTTTMWSAGQWSIGRHNPDWGF